MQNYPPILGIEELSKILGRSPTVIKRDRSLTDRKHTLPPARKIDGTKQPLWLLSDVIDWLSKQPIEDEPQKKKIGAPTKAERIAKREGSKNEL